MSNHNRNYVKVEMAAISENVSFARIVAAGFIAQLDPTVEEVSDIKTAVSEAVTNAIIHGYENVTGNVTENVSENVSENVTMQLSSVGRDITIEVSDKGVGIENVEAVREPMFTTKPDLERSGLGFTVMESFMDSVEIKSTLGAGTTVVLTKKLTEALLQ